MKTTNENGSVLSIQDQVLRAIQIIVSRALLGAATKQLTDLSAQLDQARTELNQAATQLGSTKEERAKAILAGTFTVDESTIRRGRQKIEAIEEVMRALQNERSEMRQKTTREVNAALRIIRRDTVQRIATALKDLRACAEESAAIRKLVAEAGLDGSFIDSVEFFPCSTPGGFDDLWFAARRTEGYEV